MLQSVRMMVPAYLPRRYTQFGILTLSDAVHIEHLSGCIAIIKNFLLALSIRERTL